MHSIGQDEHPWSPHTGPTEVLLRLTKEQIPAIRKTLPELSIQWSDKSRCWVYTPKSGSIPFPQELIPYLPQPTGSSKARTYLYFPYSSDEAAGLGILWDHRVKCYYYPGNPDLLPIALSCYRPPPFSWSAWCQQRVNPSTTRCQSMFTKKPLLPPGEELASAMFQAALAGQPGFLYVAPPSPARSSNVWQAVHSMLLPHASLVAIITSAADIGVWQHILQYFGTQPASVILLSYRELHLLDPRIPRDETTPPALIPSFVGATLPDIIIWDQAHALRSTEQRRMHHALHFASRARWNLWVSNNLAATANQLDIIDPLLKSRGSSSETIMATPSAEPWLSWDSSPRGPASRELQNILFKRTSFGALGAVSATTTPFASPHITLRPLGPRIPDNDPSLALSWGGQPSPEAQANLREIRLPFLSTYWRLLVAEGVRLVIVCPNREITDTVSKAMHSSAPAIFTASSRPGSFPQNLFHHRCNIVERAILPRTAPLHLPTPGRIVVTVDLPTSIGELEELVCMVGPGGEIQLTYLQFEPEERILNQMPLNPAGLFLNDTAMPIYRY